VTYEPTFTPGRTYRRQALHEAYGGQRKGGISTPADADLIFLFTGQSGAQVVNPLLGLRAQPRVTTSQWATRRG
jgi:hypothetical protein